MAVPTNKDELLEAINSSFDKLNKGLHDVPLSVVDQCSLEGHVKGTQISVANLVAYLVGWNELVLKWLDRDAAGEPFDLPETGVKWNELGNSIAITKTSLFRNLSSVWLGQRCGLSR